MKVLLTVSLCLCVLPGCGKRQYDQAGSSEKDAALTVSKNDSTAAIRKILCLHGGGGNTREFQDNPGINSLRKALGSDYELVFAQAPDGGLWMRDPPGGKKKPTTDPDWAAESVSILNAIVEEQGPFYGILGYSQGAAFIPVYLSRVSGGTFQIAAMFGGYLPTTHQGLISRIEAKAPFDNIPALVWLGVTDWIANDNLASPFKDPTLLLDSRAGHVVPSHSDTTFDRVVQAIKKPIKDR